jgi:peptidoglycan hydrolase CwlO-like protein
MDPKKGNGQDLPPSDEEEKQDPPASSEPEKSSQKPSGGTPTGDETPKGYVTEESYQGLQRVVAKKDNELESLKKQIETLSTQLEETKADTSKLTGTKGQLEQELQDAKTKLTELETSRDGLDKQLRQQGIIMQEFPNLATLAQYIPPADDDDQFRANAKNFSEAMSAFVKSGVKQVMQGGAPPQPPSDDTASETEEDQLWRTVYNTAGVPGKEKEYEEANRRLQEVLAAKK